MTGPAIFQPGDPSVSGNPIFNTNQNVATGVPNLPGRFAGSADAINQLVQLEQSRKDQALGKLARIHAAIDAGVYPASIMDSPEVQALFPQAGLDALAHQQLLPKVSDITTQSTAQELNTNPIFAQGSPATLMNDKLPSESAANVQQQANIDTQQPAVARVVGKLPVPAAAAIDEGTAVTEAGNKGAAAQTDTKGLQLSDKAVVDAQTRYGKDPQFAAFVQELHAGVDKPYIEALKQAIASSGLDKQAQGNAATILGQAIQSAPVDFQNEHKDWLDKQTQESNAFRQTFQLSNLSDDEVNAKVADHMTKWNFDHKEPTYEAIVTRNWLTNSRALGMTPQQATDLLRQTIHIVAPQQQRLHTAPNRSGLIGSIIEQAKHDPQHITFDPGDGKGPITVSLTQIYGAKSLFTKAEVDYMQQSLSGKNPKFVPGSGQGAGGSSHRPVSPVQQVPPSPTQVP